MQRNGWDGQCRLRYGRRRHWKTSGCWRVRNGQEVPEQTDEGDSDAPPGVRVHQDGRISRGGYLKGLTWLKHWVEQDFSLSICLIYIFSSCCSFFRFFSRFMSGDVYTVYWLFHNFE